MWVNVFDIIDGTDGFHNELILDALADGEPQPSLRVDSNARRRVITTENIA